jgi:hypothetical protein
MTRDSTYSSAALRTGSTDKDAWIIGLNAPDSCISFFLKWKIEVSMKNIAAWQSNIFL